MHMNADMRAVLSAILRGDNQGATDILASIDDPRRGLALTLELSVFSAAMMHAMFGDRAAEMLDNYEVPAVSGEPNRTPQQPPPGPTSTGMYL